MSAIPLPHSAVSRTSSQQASDLPLDCLYRLSVDEYHAMIQHGVLSPDTRVELLEGLLVAKMPESPAHVLAAKLVRRALEQLFPDGGGWHVATQDPVTTQDSEPKPDIAVIRGDPRDYAARHPLPGETAILVEVLHSSLPRDRGVKLRVYARAGISAYWIVSLANRTIEVHTEPDAAAESPCYTRVERFSTGQQVPVHVEGQQVGYVPVIDLLP